MWSLDYGRLIYFLFGIVSGLMLFTFTFVYFSIRGKHLDTSVVHKPSADVDEEDLKVLILDKQRAFKRAYKKSDINVGKLTFELSFELLEEIAQYYYPESKHATLELSVNELITLNRYITQRIDTILEKPVLKNTRNVRITKVVQAYEKKKLIDQNKLVRAYKNKVVKKTIKVTAAAVNVVNPGYWFKKLVINTTLDALTKKICLTVIGVVGEETSKIYSKKLFDRDLDFDLVDEALERLEKGEIDDDDL
ncbi:MAG: hypothetical protein EA374_05095 [Acholeplasmatales bacterium]|nr:MAG: hypothetical protein EA374_05095 [Acholeplasmatales bacterium]